MNSKNNVIPAKAGIQEIKLEADNRLAEIIARTAERDALLAEYETARKEVDKKFAARLEAFEALKGSAEKALIQTMKFNKSLLFDGTDVVNLAHGSLIRNVGDKVSIPHTALDACKLFGYTEAIKVVESLDRDAIEKWPDAVSVPDDKPGP